MRLLRTVVSWILAVFVNTLLNLMDAVTYGRLLFPIQTPLFSQYDYLGMCMYLLATSTAQLVISVGSSFRKGATGCAMVENIPFYHAISLALATRIVDEKSMMATILAAYILTAMLTGILFAALALLDLDRLVHKIPRTVLVGSMGGIGMFLLVTGLEMATNETLSFFGIGRLFSSWITFGLWSIAIASAASAFILEVKYRMPFVTPLLSVGLVLAFYIVIGVLPYSLEDLRELGWLMRPPQNTADPLEFYSFLSIRLIDFPALISVIPIVVGATLFGSLHVPINVPSFSRLTNQSFSMKRELWTQTISNWVTASFGGVPNYFVYTNSLLFLRAGATHRIAGILLALSTAAVLFYGLDAVGYIPTVIVMFLIFYLSICLLWEAIVGSYQLCSHLEYGAVLGTILAMQAYGFVPGISIGVLLASIPALLHYHRSKRAWRMTKGDDLVIGSPAFERFVDATMIHTVLTIEFEGYLFFGNVVEELRKLSFTRAETEVLILDFNHVNAIDMNAREGLLATLSALTFEIFVDRGIIVCLGLSDERLKRNIRNLGATRLLLDEGRPRAWLHKYLAASLDQSTVDEEETRLLVETSSVPVLSSDREAYERDLGSERRLLSTLRSSAHILLFEAGESIASKLPDPLGYLVIYKGVICSKDQKYGKGAWLPASLAFAGQSKTTVEVAFVESKVMERELANCGRELLLYNVAQ
jgi:SulP family sulfate permease